MITEPDYLLLEVFSVIVLSWCIEMYFWKL